MSLEYLAIDSSLVKNNGFILRTNLLSLTTPDIHTKREHIEIFPLNRFIITDCAISSKLCPVTNLSKPHLREYLFNKYLFKTPQIAQDFIF